MSASASCLADVHEGITAGDEFEVVTCLRTLTANIMDADLSALFDQVCKAKMAVAAHLIFERGVAPTLERYEQALLCGIEAIAREAIVRGAQDADSKRARIRTAIRVGYPELASDLLYRGMDRWGGRQPLFSREEFERLKSEIDADDLTGPRRAEDQRKINASKEAYDAERAAWCKENMAPPPLGFRYRDALDEGDVEELRVILADGLLADSSWHDASLLEHAVLAGETGFAKELLRHGATTDHEAGVLLTHSVEHERPEMVRALVAGGADINATRFDGCTALHVAVSRTFSDALIALLLSLGAGVDRMDLRGRTVMDASRIEYRTQLHALASS